MFCSFHTAVLWSFECNEAVCLCSFSHCVASQSQCAQHDTTLEAGYEGSWGAALYSIVVVWNIITLNYYYCYYYYYYYYYSYYLRLHSSHWWNLSCFFFSVRSDSQVALKNLHVATFHQCRLQYLLVLVLLLSSRLFMWKLAIVGIIYV